MYVVGEPVVGVVVLRDYDDHLFLDSVAVHPDAHGQGLGEVRLCTNALMWENQEIYPRYGYEAVERRTDGVYDRVHYRKPLV